jgi:hypothetical protein
MPSGAPIPKGHLGDLWGVNNEHHSQTNSMIGKIGLIKKKTF